MSTTTRGPPIAVARLITPSGSRYRDESSGGVTHPFSQSDAIRPRVGGGSSGNAGGVGEATVGDSAGVIDGRSTSDGPPPSFVHATTTNATTSDIAALETSRSSIESSREDIVRTSA